MRFQIWIVAAVLIALGGCASKPSMRAGPATMPAATRPSGPEALSLEEIRPRPVLAASRPATAPTTQRAPLESLELFAHARDAFLRDQRYTAITLLEQAIKLDPDSYELNFALGQAYGGLGPANDQAIEAYAAAAKLQPEHLDLQTELGRQYLAKGNLDKSIEHLRLALQTKEYHRDDPMSAVTEYYLARALQSRGYDQASIEIYQRLFDRLQRRGVPARLSPELAYLVNRPEDVAARLAELYEKRGQYDAAIRSLEFVAKKHPDMLDAQRRIIEVLMTAGRQPEAANRATETVRKFKASNESLDLLKEVYQKQGGDAAVADELLRLHRQTPDDRAILYALIDVLGRSGRTKEGIDLLEAAAGRSNYESQIVQQLFKLYDATSDTNASARLLIVTLARRPDSIRDLNDQWLALLRYSRRNRLTIARLQAIEVPPEAQASKLLWISRLAQLWNRDILARTSLEQSVKLTPPFAPSYRVLVMDYATRADWDDARRKRETDALIESARAQKDDTLAAELEGLILLSQAKPADAVRRFALATRLGGSSIDLRLSYAVALRGAGDEARCQQVLWKLVADKPNCEDAYAALFRGYIESREPDQAMPVLRQWLNNNPNSTSARVVESAVFLQARQQDRAQEILLDLFARDPDSADVLSAVGAFYQRVDRIDEFITMLEAERTKHPENRMAIENLVALYASRKQLADATRVLDATRAAVAGDSDLLYYVGSLYSRIDQKNTLEQILQEIVDKDPHYAPASNDLGYTWADRGENLGRAEALIRTAVREEPDNQSYLDSLGWVLYKRGKFDESRKLLTEAIEPASYPDPVVLDHLGDVLYRLGEKKEALRQWKRSQERLNQNDNSEREDLKQLRLQLQQKIRQADANQAVSVAPTAVPTR